MQYLFEGLAGVDMTMYNNANDKECETTTVTSPCSEYECEVDYTGPGVNWVSLTATRKATSSAEYVDGGMVTVTDVAILNQHIFDSAHFYSMVQFIAADIDGNGAISSNDKDKLHLILLYPTLPARIVDSWNIFFDGWYAINDFVDYFRIYEPSAEAYYDLWDTYSGAFNHYVGTTYTPTSYQLGATSSSSYSGGFTAIKIGDLNFSTAAATSCLGGELPEELDQLITSDPDEVVDRSSRITHTKISSTWEDYSTGMLEINVDRLSDIAGIQLYLKLGDGVHSIDYLGSDLKCFTAENIYFESSSKTLNIVWVEEIISPHRDLDLNSLVKFRIHGKVNNDEPVLRQNHEKYSCVVDKSLKESIVVLGDDRRATDQVVVYPNPSEDLVYFRLPGNDDEQRDVAIKLFSTDGIEMFRINKKSVNGVISLDLNDYFGLSSIIFYEIQGKGRSYKGKFIKVAR